MLRSIASFLLKICVSVEQGACECNKCPWPGAVGMHFLFLKSVYYACEPPEFPLQPPQPPPAAQEGGMPLPMGRTGPGLYGKAPVFSGLGTHICFSVAGELHLGQAGTSSPKTRSSNLLPQAVQTKSYMGMIVLLIRCRNETLAAAYRNMGAPE